MSETISLKRHEVISVVVQLNGIKTRLEYSIPGMAGLPATKLNKDGLNETILPLLRQAFGNKVNCLTTR